MKKFIAIFAIIATFGFVACNNSTETKDDNTDSTQAEATEEVTETPAAADSTATPAATDSTATPAPATK